MDPPKAAEESSSEEGKHHLLILSGNSDYLLSLFHSFKWGWFLDIPKSKSLLNILGKVITREHFLYVLQI